MKALARLGFTRCNKAVKKMILPFLVFLSACGSRPSNENPQALSERNQDCIAGQLSGEFLLQMSDGTMKALSAASTKHLLQKIKSPRFQAELKRSKTKVVAFEPQFKIKTLNFARGPIVNARGYFIEGPELLNASFLWDLGFRGNGSVTALIDSGYDISHQLLQNSVLENTADFGNDEDQNSFRGDRFGWDSVNDQPLTGDLGSHGTNIGSAIAASHRSDIRLSLSLIHI